MSGDTPVELEHATGNISSDDARVDPRLLSLLRQFGLGSPPEDAVEATNGDLSLVHAAWTSMEENMGPFMEKLGESVTADGLREWTEETSACDEHTVTLHVTAPVDDAQKCGAAIVYVHGGGMSIMRVRHERAAQRELARRGAVVVAVEFRNASGAFGNHPYPAGLNDVVAGLYWADANRARLAVRSVTLFGTSGGARLAAAAALAAKRASRAAAVDGVFLQCPYLAHYSGDAPPPELRSYASEKRFLSLTWAAIVQRALVYDPEGRQATNPLCHPLVASEEDLRDLPPFYVEVAELDALRSEGILFARRLAKAGVSTTLVTIHGVTHCAHAAFASTLPDLAGASWDAQVSFSLRCRR